MKSFKNSKIRQSFYDWHGGQDSHIYAAASSGLVDDVEGLQAEIRDDAAWLVGEPSKANFPNMEKTAKQAAESAWLRTLADSLPNLLSKPFTHSYDGRVYRALPWAEEGPTFISVSIRRDCVSNEPGLFFWSVWNNRPELTAYFHNGQHGQASYEYMRACRPADAQDEDCQTLVKEWESIGPVGTYAKIVKRLAK